MWIQLVNGWLEQLCPIDFARLVYQSIGVLVMNQLYLIVQFTGSFQAYMGVVVVFVLLEQPLIRTMHSTPVNAILDARR